jgi:holo-[acyl-carrier protein] synthase
MIQTGIDLVEIKRIQKSMKNPRFLTRVFSSDEIAMFRERKFPVQTVAANFCAKEAFAKALGCGIRGFAFKDISVLRDSLGRPYLRLDGPAEAMAKAAGAQSFSVSLTHTRSCAAAVVVCECRKGEEK